MHVKNAWSPAPREFLNSLNIVSKYVFFAAQKPVAV